MYDFVDSMGSGIGITILTTILLANQIYKNSSREDKLPRNYKTNRIHL